MVTPAAKREAVAHLVETYETSERRACRLIRADRKTVRYRPRRPKDEELRRRLRELAAEQRRFGYRRLHVLLRAEGHLVNRKKTQRLYREEGLTVRKRKGRKRAVGSRAPILIEVRPNARWSVDFVHDQLPSDLADSIAFALRFSGRKRVHDADAFMAKIAADRIVRHLENAGYVVLKKSRTLTFFAVNRHASKSLDLELDLQGFGNARIADHQVMTNADLEAVNTSSGPLAVAPKEGSGPEVRDERLTAKLPLYSYQMLRLALA
jgi:HTH-like domain/Alpha-L-arabinofuranosidase C-terminal domain